MQPSNTVAGAAISQPIQVYVEDQFGNLVSTDASNVTLALGTGPGTLSGTLTEQAAGGIATFGDLSINKVGAADTLTAVDANFAGNTTSNTFSITPAAAHNLLFGVQPTNAIAGRTISPAVTVDVVDAFGNVVTSDTSNVTLTPSSNTLFGATVVSAVAGVATFSNLSIETVGTGYSLNAADGGLVGTTSGTFNIAPAAADHLAFFVQPTTVTAGVAIAPAVKVEVLDQFNNLIANATNAITLAVATGPGTLTGTTTVNAIGGTATFSNLQITTTGTYTLSESAIGGLSGLASTSFAVTPSTATQVVFGQQPGATVAGLAIGPAVTVKIEDAFGNVVTTDNSDRVTVAIVSGPGSFAGTSTTTVTASAGVATFTNLTLNTAGNQHPERDRPPAACSPARRPAASRSLPAAIDQLVFGQQPTTTRPPACAINPDRDGQDRGPVRQRRHHRQHRPGERGHRQHGPGTLHPAAARPPSGDRQQRAPPFSNLHINTAGSYTLSERSPRGGPSSPGQPPTASAVAPAAASQLVFGQQPVNTIAGAAISPAVTVKIEDAFGNVITSDNTDQVTLGIAERARAPSPARASSDHGHGRQRRRHVQQPDS